MNSLVKKAVGTFVFLGIILGAVAVSVPSDARAQFINTVFGLVVDGVVLDVDSNKIVVGTSGTEPIEIWINNRTRIIRGPVEDGDQVKVIARVRGGEITARIIKKIGSGPGYGFEGDRVIVQKAKVVNKGDSWFVVDSNAAIVTFVVTPGTRFFRTNFATMEVGDYVKVLGEDGGSDFIARYVFGQHKHRYSRDRYDRYNKHDSDDHWEEEVDAEMEQAMDDWEDD